MKTSARLASCVFGVAACSMIYFDAHRVAGRSLTANEMRTTCGSSSGGCVLSAALTDCNKLDEACNWCFDSQSKETVEAEGSGKVKRYLGADRKICTTPTTPNNKVCDPGTVTCWVERSCDPGPVQTDKSCNGNHAGGDCVTPNTPGTWYCKKYSLGGPTGFSSTKHDDNCI